MIKINKAVLLSVEPNWFELIAELKKLFEIRKTKPNLKVPFKVYIYCTKKPGKDVLHTYVTSGVGRKNYGVVEHWRNGNQIVDVNAHLPAYRYNSYLVEGKVVGEFICDEIVPVEVLENGSIKDYNCYSLYDSYVPYDKISEYIGCGNTGYAWHISNLIIYEKPKELKDFYISCFSGCDNCEYKSWDYSFGGDKDLVCTVGNKKPVIKAPQSYCYVADIGPQKETVPVAASVEQECPFCKELKMCKDNEAYFKENSPRHKDVKTEYKVALVTETYEPGIDYCTGRCTYSHHPLKFCPTCGKPV